MQEIFLKSKKWVLNPPKTSADWLQYEKDFADDVIAMERQRQAMPRKIQKFDWSKYPPGHVFETTWPDDTAPDLDDIREWENWIDSIERNMRHKIA